MEKFGEYLKAQREKKGIRLEEIASITKIHLHSLELLEVGQWDQLPPEPFIRGFIIAYAKYVGLDPKETIERFMLEQHGEKAEPEGSLPNEPTPVAGRESASDVIDKSHDFPAMKVAVGGGAMALVLLVVIFIYVGKKTEPNQDVGKIVGTISEAPAPVSPPAPAPSNPPVAQVPLSQPIVVNEKPPTVEEPRNVASPNMKADAPKESQVISTGPISAPPVPVAGTAKSEPVAVAPVVPQPSTAPSPAPPSEFKHEVSVEGKARTWIKVVIDDLPPSEFFLPEGQQETYKAKNKLKIVLGNSTGSTVTHNGELVKGEKFSGTIRSYIFPPTARFPQDKPSRRSSSTKAPMESPGEDTGGLPDLEALGLPSEKP